MPFKYEQGQILVEGGGYEYVTFYRIEGRTSAYVTTVELEDAFTPDADQRPGFTKGSYLPTDRIHMRSQLGPRRHRISIDENGNEYTKPPNKVWDGAPVPYSNC
jgi:hypothetical protein